MNFFKLKKPSTFLKYLFSYVLIFTVLMATFFLILRSQLNYAYESQQTERLQGHMSAVSAQLNEEFQVLSLVDAAITRNQDIVYPSFSTEGKYARVLHTELNKLDSASRLISNIVFYSKFNGFLVSPKRLVSYEDGVFAINDYLTQKSLSFDPEPYLNSNDSRLILLDDGETRELLYFPRNSSYSKYIYFYFLDLSVLQTQIRSLLSNEVPAVALLDESGRIVTGSGMAAYGEDPALHDLAPGIRTLEDGSSLLLSDPLYGGFYLAAAVSDDYLPRQVNSAFLGSFASLLGLSILGILLVYVAMLVTYRPLHRLMKNLGHESKENRRYLEVLSKTYSELNSQKAQLEQALADYRESMTRYRDREAATRPYPQEELNTLAKLLEDNSFAEAGALLEGILIRFGQGEAGDWFQGCILLDCLILINNAMSKSRIDYDGYSQIFIEAVHQCRNIPERKDFDTLSELIHELLFIYETEATGRLLHTTPLRQMVENNFCDPNFSLSVVASAFHVSISRMSILFKEEMGVGFTECIWQMRLEKAKQLLQETQMSLEEVSFAVGYLAHSSFGRKFKQATGMTPSQYRTEQI